MRTLETVNQEYTNTLTLAGEKQYLIKRLSVELSNLNAKADKLNIEASEVKKKVTATSEITESTTPIVSHEMFDEGHAQQLAQATAQDHVESNGLDVGF